ncbi:MAG: flavodoxin family protein [Polyangiales bacterium]
MTHRSFLFVLSSTRSPSNSEQLARRAAEHLPPNGEARFLRLSDHPLPPFVDTRHDVGFGPLCHHAQRLADATLAATDLVIVAPVYWYSLPAAAKSYLDHWSHWMRVEPLAFKATMRGRRLWSIVVDSSEPEDAGARPLIGCLELTAQYLDMTYAGTLLGHANRPGEIVNDAHAMKAAETFFASAG